MQATEDPASRVATAVVADPDPIVMWLDDDHVNPEWMARHVVPHVPRVKECRATDLSNAPSKGETVRQGGTLCLHLTFQDEPTETRILKQVAEHRLALSQQLGLAREALFYRALAPRLSAPTEKEQQQQQQQLVPIVDYCMGDMEQGTKVLVMQDLRGNYVDSGIFFGQGNPNNWKRDLEAQLSALPGPPPSPQEVARVSFQAMAAVHARFWKDESLLTLPWLRASAWLKGEGQASWEASQQVIQKSWTKYNDETTQQSLPDLVWDPALHAIVKQAMQNISWSAQVKRLSTKSGHWTLVHGDFWPGNVQWRVQQTKTDSTESPTVLLLDWEMVGLGSGPQDLGQYVLSHLEPAVRRQHERDLVRAYYDALLAAGVSVIEFDWETCWREYVVGGLERWLWFLVYFLGLETLEMRQWAQFFHDQMAAFVNDHQLTVQDICQPRP